MRPILLLVVLVDLVRNAKNTLIVQIEKFTKRLNIAQFRCKRIVHEGSQEFHGESNPQGRMHNVEIGQFRAPAKTGKNQMRESE